LADTRGEVRTYTGDQPVAMAAKNVKERKALFKFGVLVN
jgi:hypothetical protein